jgi:hypothetical protein
MYVVLEASGHTGHVVATNLLTRGQKFVSSAETHFIYSLLRQKVQKPSSLTSPTPVLLSKLSNPPIPRTS